MQEEYKELLSQIVQETQNDVIVFTIVLLIGLAAVVVPILITLNRSKKNAQEHQLEEKQQLISVVQQNTEAITTLKTSLDINNSTTNTLLQSINDNTNEAAVKIAKILTSQIQIAPKIERVIGDNDNLHDYVHEHRQHIEEIGIIKEESLEIKHDLEESKVKLNTIDERTKTIIDQLIDINKNILDMTTGNKSLK
jgi:type II secretory pathway component PulM